MEKVICISIIIPIYNVAPYLSQCLDSFYKQIDDSIEVILVNDGSTDKSLTICEEYARKYTNTIIVNKENGGLSDARNAGTKVATGRFIYYLDSDDWLAPNAIKTLYDFAIENHCEVVQGGFYYAYTDYLLYDAKYKKPFILERSEAMLQLIKNDYVKNFAWGKLYKSDIVKCYQFPKGKYYEDSYWQHLVLNEVTHYGIVPIPLYYYRQRNSGISGEFSSKNLDLLEGYEERLKFVQKHYPEYVNQLALVLWNMAYSFMESATNKCDEKTICAYAEFWQRINKSYQTLFDVALHSNVKYRLWKTFPRFIKLYELTNKAVDRVFKKSTLVKIDYNG